MLAHKKIKVFFSKQYKNYQTKDHDVVEQASSKLLNKTRPVVTSI